MLAYVPRDATFAAVDTTALSLMDRFALHRDSLLTVLRLSLNDEVPEDAEPLNRISHLVALFNEMSNKFHRLLITHYSVVRGRMLVLADVINRDIGVGQATCLYLCVTNIQEPCLPEPALSSRCFLSLPGKG